MFAARRVWVIAIVALFSGASPLLAAPPAYLRTIGSPAPGPGQLGLVIGVTLGSDGDLFVLDQRALVTRFHPDGSVVATWNPVGDLPFGPTRVQGIEATRAGILYVSVAGGGYPNRIRMFDEDGNLIGDLTDDGFGNVLGEPWGMGYTSGSGLIVTDIGGRLWRYKNSQLSFLANMSGCSAGQLWSPTGVAVVGGEIYETEYSERLQRLSSTGAFIAELGTPGGCGQIRSYPRFVAPTNVGTLIVADMLTNVVRLVTTAGAVQETWGGSGSGHGSFSGVTGAVVSANGTIYIADGWNNRVEVYGAGPTAVTGASWGQIKIRYR